MAGGNYVDEDGVRAPDQSRFQVLAGSGPSADYDEFDERYNYPSQPQPQPMPGGGIANSFFGAAASLAGMFGGGSS